MAVKITFAGVIAFPKITTIVKTKTAPQMVRKTRNPIVTLIILKPYKHRTRPKMIIIAPHHFSRLLIVLIALVYPSLSVF
jgi:hypothetical protein